MKGKQGGGGLFLRSAAVLFAPVSLVREEEGIKTQQERVEGGGLEEVGAGDACPGAL